MKRRDFLVASASVAGSLLPGVASAQSKPCPQPTLGIDTGQSATTPCGSTTAEADWQSRISGSGVVWYHDFRSDNEVNAFRWSGSLSNGNDPGALGSNATYCRRISTDGITGNCLEIVRPTGSTDGAMWWRPFSPIQGGTTTGNGRGVGQDDPGAGGTIAPNAYAATQNGNQISSWLNKGFYANPKYAGTVPNSTFDGNDYYIQARVKIDPNRISTSLNRALNPGKLFFFTRTDLSLTPQEIVIESYCPGSDTTKDYFGMYRSGGMELYSDAPSSTYGNQPGTTYGTVGSKICQLDNSGGQAVNCWYWPLGQWTTVLWHVTNGTAAALDGSSSDANTHMEVWVAGPGATSYTKIWDEANVALPFDLQWGHNALICAAYMNGANMNQFYQRYCQIIFSKQMIPCPQV